MDDGFVPLDGNEVLYIRDGRILMSNPTFKVSEFLDALAQTISDREDDWPEEKEAWFAEGLNCEVLRFGTMGWQRGKVRIRIEFCPQKALDRAPDRAPRREPEREPERNRRLRPPEEFYPDEGMGPDEY